MNWNGIPGHIFRNGRGDQGLSVITLKLPALNHPRVSSMTDERSRSALPQSPVNDEPCIIASVDGFREASLPKIPFI